MNIDPESPVEVKLTVVRFLKIFGSHYWRLMLFCVPLLFVGAFFNFGHSYEQCLVMQYFDGLTTGQGMGFFIKCLCFESLREAFFLPLGSFYVKCLDLIEIIINGRTESWFVIYPLYIYINVLLIYSYIYILFKTMIGNQYSDFILSTPVKSVNNTSRKNRRTFSISWSYFWKLIISIVVSYFVFIGSKFRKILGEMLFLWEPYNESMHIVTANEFLLTWILMGMFGTLVPPLLLFLLLRKKSGNARLILLKR